MWALLKLRGAAIHSRPTNARWFHASTSRLSAVTLPLLHAHDIPDTSSHEPPSLLSSALKKQNERAYVDAVDKLKLNEDLPPMERWARYTELVEQEGPENIAPEVHRQILRMCVPSPKKLRWFVSRYFVSGSIHKDKPYRYEHRLQAVVANMNRVGWAPRLDDYHFILEQFAAVGHYIGTRNVLKEMIREGFEPTQKTIGLCLQSIAYRLSLPCKRRHRKRLVRWTRLVLDEVLQEMWTRKIPFTSVNMDLALRVLREKTDVEGFEQLLRVSYGLDLANPDKLALEHVNKAEPTALLAFSTATLNTTIDTLGRFAPVSKLVTAFEVITNPPVASNPPFALEDDDDDFGVPPDPQATLRPPYAEPNTKTYTLLLHHLSAQHQTTFVRHYLIQAMQAEFQMDRRIRGLIEAGVPLEKIPSHNMAVNRDMLQSVFNHAVARDKGTLMEFVARATKRALRRKRVYLEYYQGLLEKLSADQPIAAEAVPDDEDVIQDSASSSSLSSEETSQPAYKPTYQDAVISRIFDVDLDAPPNSQAKPRSHLDIPTHIRILWRDIREISEFSVRVEYKHEKWLNALKRDVARRAAQGKSVYLRSLGKSVLAPPEVVLREDTKTSAAEADGGKRQEVEQGEGTERIPTQVKEA